MLAEVNLSRRISGLCHTSRDTTFSVRLYNPKKYHPTFLAVHQEASQLEAFRKRLEEASPGLDEEIVGVFEELFKSGELLGGVDKGGEDDIQRLGSGFFAVILQVCNAPDEEVDGCSRSVTPLLWSRGCARINHVIKVFRACISAGVPLVIVGDAPIESVMGRAARDALERGYSGVGKTGSGSVFLKKWISKEFVRSWTAGGVEENCLQHPWTIQNLEVSNLKCMKIR